ncbi:MAG: helix-turn-helix domain-containing protein, partial [Deltaproteobacteria bacterium]|nr:helix-turn-helix domain-containing protein [Deltaproteobacteria bacterium]
MVKIGRIIKAFRSQRNLKLKDLAALADISPSYLSQIENDQVNMNMSVLDNIS